jgi:hypothetical protein
MNPWLRGMGNPIPHHEKPFTSAPFADYLLYYMHDMSVESWLRRVSGLYPGKRKSSSSLNNRTAVSTWVMGLDQNSHTSI